jgi:porin
MAGQPANAPPDATTPAATTPASTALGATTDPNLVSPNGFGFPIPPSDQQLPMLPADTAPGANPLEKIKAAHKGNLQQRAGLTGDWYGLRDWTIDNGLIFYADTALFYQGIAAGGYRQRSSFIGHDDLVLTGVGERLGLWKGFSFRLRAEARYGDNGLATPTNVGSTNIPPAIMTLLPYPTQDIMAITELFAIQQLGDRFTLQAGKLTTLDGDPLAFAAGRGVRQFSNGAFVFNPIFSRIVPYSTLGAGLVMNPRTPQGPTLVVSVLDPGGVTNVLDPAGAPRTSGFQSLFSRGVILSGSGRKPVKLFGRSGDQTFTGIWTSQAFPGLVALGQRVPPFPRHSGSWALAYSFDQYIWQDPKDEKRGWGVFGRAGLSDGNPNPIDYFLSIGVGTNGTFASRPNDMCGIGYYFSGISGRAVVQQLATGPVPLERGYGIEMYYNYAIAPWARLTPDLQVIQGNVRGADPALILGLRLQVVY